MSKAIAIIEMPKSCENCIFRVTKYYHPFWAKAGKNTKGYYCQLDPERRVADIHIDDDVFKFENCPLVEVETLAQRALKVGDTIYYRTYKDNGRKCVGVQPHTVKRIELIAVDETGSTSHIQEIGKTIFLSEEQANNNGGIF